MKQNQAIKFNGRTLRQFIEELKAEGCIEILRVLPLEKGAYIVSYGVEK